MEEDAESWKEVEDKAQRAQYTNLGMDLFNKEKNQGDLRRRSKQAIMHLTFTEIRITELEKELRTLKSELHDMPDDFKLSVKKKKYAVCKPILKRSEADEFRVTNNSTSIPLEDRPTLEVLYDRVPYHRHDDPDQQPKLVRRGTASLGEDHFDWAKQDSPERLRIRSWALINHLEKVCKETLGNYKVYQNDPQDAAGLIVLRPFKVVYGNEQKIRDSIKEIETLATSKDKDEQGNDLCKGILNDTEFEYKDLLRELHLFVEFIDKDLKSTFEFRKRLEDGTATDIAYADLWHLFNLGDVVISRNSTEQAYRVVNYTGGRNPLINRMVEENDRTPPLDGFVVDCCSVLFDGTDYVPKLRKISIRRFSGRRPIDSLEVFPLKFHPNSSTLQESLLAQGLKYLELTCAPFCHRMFRGCTIDEPSQDLEAQVIVDIAQAVNAEADWRPTKRITEEDLTQNDRRETQMPTVCEHSTEGCCGSDYIFKDFAMNSELSHPFRRDYGGLFTPRTADELNDDIILLPNWVHAFVLRLRQWITLKMSDLTEVLFENDFDELMISDNHKQTVLALVQTHEKAKVVSLPAAQTSQSVGATLDLVKGKGTGLILLLHGEPGVGKTSTAECVADKTKRPLFPITCGDIGETAMEVESNLHHNFRLAHKWGCVLLLDEADVFLAKRNKTDLRRNAVTSVFLRSLEYYAGILFLTTNRVGGIDPAFKSRIHLSVYYPRLDLETTLQLYGTFLRRTREEQRKSGVVVFQIKNKEVLSFAKHHYRELKKEGYNTWNGRQIRNAFQTAIALVEHQATQLPPGSPKPTLGKEQFKIVAKGSKEFDSYLIRTLQGADDEIAMRDQWRNDQFELGLGGAPSVTSKSAKKSSSSKLQRGKALLSEESSSDTVTESESDSEAGSEEDEGEDYVVDKQKTTVTTTKETVSGATGDTGGAFNITEYEQFMKFKAMLEATGK
ncbi:hypothetical protein BGZ63DRAFT_361223 [Mariannaea sp. PMI_226]|nr:hypothetical protein BGZ63DRAFT_361223 [Mariannaea sp. PMI_226]